MILEVRGKRYMTVYRMAEWDRREMLYKYISMAIIGWIDWGITRMYECRHDVIDCFPRWCEVNRDLGSKA
jgi:hypothetical protein